MARSTPTVLIPAEHARRSARSVGFPRPLSLRAAAALTGLCLTAVAACTPPADDEESPGPAPVAETTTVSPTVEPTRQVPPEPVIPIVWPLTGVAAAEIPARPSVSVKIENTSVARPQSGLDQADVVWETIVEFEVSRLIAVFHSQVPAEVGPIRSVRPVDSTVTAPMRGLLVFSGGQPGILHLVNTSPVQPISHDAGARGLYRVGHRSAPHNVYGSVQTFLEQADADHTAAPAQQFGFAKTAAQATSLVSGTPAASLAFRLSGQSQPNWSWDAASGTWLRSEGSTPATAASGARLSAVNVVAITAPHPGTKFGAQNGAIVPTYEIVGEGEAVVATGGTTVVGRWVKPAGDAPMTLVLPDGQPLLLAPGNTWVEMIPQGKGSLTVG